MARKDIHKDAAKAGTNFSTENQPSPEAKSEGWKRRRTLTELAEALLNNQGIKKAKVTAIECGIDLKDDEFTLEVVMTLRQIELAIKKGNTQAYNAAMDRMKGKPMQSVELTGKDGEQLINTVTIIQLPDNGRGSENMPNETKDK